MKRHNVYTALAVAALLTTGAINMTVNAATTTATATTTTTTAVTKAATTATDATKEDIRNATRQVSSLVSTDTAIKTKLPTTADKTRDAIVANKLSQYKATAADLAKAGSDTDGAATTPTFPWAQAAVTHFTKAGIISDTYALGDKVTAKKALNLLTNLAKYDAKQYKYTEIKADKLLPVDASTETVTRSTFAKAVAGFVAQRNEKLKKRVTVPANAAPVTFADNDNLSTDLKTALTTLSNQGIVSYGNNVAFRPDDIINGAEAIVMLDRINHPIALPTKVVPTVATASSVTASNDIIRKEATEAAKATAEAKAANKANASAANTATITKTDTKTVKNSTTANTTATTAGSSITTATIDTDNAVAPVTDPTEQRNLEDALFKKLNTLYQKPENFQNYGVMYWRDNTLHVALKSGDDLTQLEKTISNDKKNSAYINKHTAFELTQFSQSEYDRIANNFKNFYSKKQPAGQILDMYPDVPHNQLIVNVTKSFDYMQDSIQSAFGSKVRVFVITPANS